jgi:hypothetical protein
VATKALSFAVEKQSLMFVASQGGVGLPPKRYNSLLWGWFLSIVFDGYSIVQILVALGLDSFRQEPCRQEQ